MKALRLLNLTLALVIIFAGSTYAQTAKIKNFKITVSGTSTMHDWESVVEKVECKATYKVDQKSLVELTAANVTIPVQSIKSPKGKMMDSKTYDAFEYEKNPNIVFVLTSQKINATSADIRGNLTMAGVTRPIDLPVSYKVLPNGDLQIVGSKKLKMTDYKMDPPTAMMGTIKVGDEVTVNFEIVLTTNTIL